MIRKIMGIALLGLLAGHSCGCGGGGAVLDRSARYRMSGSVQDANGKGLPYSSVILAGAPRGAMADQSGEFDLGGILPGRYDLTVLYLGYRSRVHSVTTTRAEDRSVTLDMVRDPSLGPAKADSLGPVTVTYRMNTSP